jgi:ketosteroid isomerase-like protein
MDIESNQGPTTTWRAVGGRNTMSEADAEIIGREFVDALNAGDSASLDRLFAEDVTWTFPGDFEFSGTHDGKTAVFERFLGPAGALFDPPATPPIELHNVVAQDGVVAVEYTARMRTAIGKNYENHYVLMLDVADGRIRHVREYNDTSHLRSVCYR